MKRARQFIIISLIAVFSIAFVLLAGCGSSCKECAGKAFKVLTPGGGAQTCDGYNKYFCEGDTKITSVQGTNCEITVTRLACPDKCLAGECVTERDVKDAAGCDQVEDDCADGLDNDCNDDIDCDDNNCLTEPICTDYDKDGYYLVPRPCAYSPVLLSDTIICANHPSYGDTIPADCDDYNDEIYPNTTEVCNNIDDDCDGDVDEGLKVLYYFDKDGDTFGDPNENSSECPGSSIPRWGLEHTDCDDNDADEKPGQRWYADADDDGYGAGTVQIACERPVGSAPNYVNYVLDGSDSDDSDPGVWI